MRTSKFKNYLHFLLQHKYYVAVYIILFVASLVFFAYKFSEEKTRQKELLEEDFENILYGEFDKYSTESGSVRSNRRSAENSEKKSITIKTEQGAIPIQLDSLKEQRNITVNPLFRSLHSVLMLKGTVSVDTIYTHYLAHLELKQIIADATLLYIAQNKDSVILGNPLLIEPSDSIACYYAGYGNEYEFTLYASPSLGSLLSACYIPILIIILFLGSGLFSFFIWRKKSRPVRIDMTNHILQIGKFILFDVSNHTLYRIDNSQLTFLDNKAAELLKAFMEALEHQLTIEQIKLIIWKGTSIKGSTVRTLIKEVKDKLNEVDREKCISLKNVGKETYRLTLSKANNNKIIQKVLTTFKSIKNYIFSKLTPNN